MAKEPDTEGTSTDRNQSLRDEQIVDTLVAFVVN